MAQFSFVHSANYGEGTLDELAYSVLGIPILMFNYWAWVYPEVIGKFLLRKTNQRRLFH